MCVNYDLKNRVKHVNNGACKAFISRTLKI